MARGTISSGGTTPAKIYFFGTVHAFFSESVAWLQDLSIYFLYLKYHSTLVALSSCILCLQYILTADLDAQFTLLSSFQRTVYIHV